MPGNITVAVSQANITVDQQNTTVAVTSTPSTVVVGESRTTSNADIRNAISNAFPITYNTTTGVIGIDPSAISGGNVVFGGNATGDITVDKSTGAFFEYNVTGNITGISLNNFNAGETATIIFTQDAIGGHQIDTTTTPGNWSAWNFASGSSTIDETPTNWSTLSIFGLGPTGGAANAYYASVVREETADTLTNLTVTGNVSAGGTISATSGFLGELTGNVIGTVSSLANHTTAGLTENTNLYLNGSGTTDDLTQGSTNLYYADSLSRAAVSVTQASASGSGTLSYDNGTGVFTYTPPDLTAFGLTNAQAQAYIQDNGLNGSGDITMTGVATFGNAATQTHTFTGNVDVTGNIEVSGNLNYRNVEDLYVRDQSITLNANAASDATVSIIANRPVAGSNTVLRWNETDDKWQFSNDGSTYQNLIGLTDLSVTTAAASGGGALSYSNTSGVFTFTPADMSGAITNAQAQAYIQSNGLAMTSNITSNSLISTTGNVQINPDIASGVGLKGLTFRSDFNLLGLGITTPQTALDIVCDGNTFGQIYVREYADTFFGPDLTTFKARGSFASPTAVLAGDRVMELKPNGHTGSGFLNTMGQIMYVDSANAISSTSMPIGFSWEGYKDGDVSGGTSYASLMKLRSNGDFQIGNLGFNSSNTAPNFSVTHGGTVSAVGNISTTANTSAGNVIATNSLLGDELTVNNQGDIAGINLSGNTISIPNNGVINFNDNLGAITGLSSFNAQNDINSLLSNVFASKNGSINGFSGGIGLTTNSNATDSVYTYALAVGEATPQGVISITQDQPTNPTKWHSYKLFGDYGAGAIPDDGINFNYYRANGSVSSPAVVGNNEYIQQTLYYGHDGTQFFNGARDFVYHDTAGGAASSNAMNLTREFTSQPSIGAETSRLRLCANGTIQFQTDGVKESGTNGGNASIAVDGTITTVANINAAGGTLTGVLTSNSNIELTDTDALFIGDMNGATQIDVYNDTGVAIAQGKAVYLTGGNQGDKPNVALANNLVSANMPAVGVVKNQIGIAAEGEVVTAGRLNIAAHGFTQGADLYVNGSGDLTTSIPTSEAELIQKIGKVVGPNHILVQGAFRQNATPNLDENNIFIGNAANRSSTVALDGLGNTSISTQERIEAGRLYGGNITVPYIQQLNGADGTVLIRTGILTPDADPMMLNGSKILIQDTDSTNPLANGSIKSDNTFFVREHGTAYGYYILYTDEACQNVLTTALGGSPGLANANITVSNFQSFAPISMAASPSTYPALETSSNTYINKAFIRNNLEIGETGYRQADLTVHGDASFINFSGNSAVTIQERSGGATAPTMTFFKEPFDGTIAADDSAGALKFTALNNSYPNVATYANIVSVVNDTTAGAEVGSIDFRTSKAGTETSTLLLKSTEANITVPLNSNSNITTTANISGNYILGDGSQLQNLPTGGNSFGTITVSGETNIQASQANAVLDIASSGDITLTTSGNTLTIGGSGGTYGNTEVENFLSANVVTANIEIQGDIISDGDIKAANAMFTDRLETFTPGGTFTLNSVRVSDFLANDPLGIDTVANSALSGGVYAAPFTGSIVYVTGDRHGSRGAPAYWSGTEWRYFSDDANVTI